MKTQFMFVFTKSIIKQEHAENIHKECMNLFTVFFLFEAISAKILEHHEANPGFNSDPQSSRQAVSTYSSGLGRYGTYVDMESPPIKLLRCDWAPDNLNLFNKS